ncbi:hypothetical protein ACGFI4_11345 [Micromonospora carbonacea]|uniref:hypothetical protein n=1 Tax=Micromonospora carbonacea TaxID=47853 RepID=UPI00371DD168
MAIWSEMRGIVRWLLRRPEPPPPPGTGQVIQAAEQAAARRQILADAQAARTTPQHCQPPENVPTVALGDETTHGRADR